MAERTGGRDGGWLAAVLTLALLMAASAPSLADTLRLERTRPDHLGPGTVAPIEPAAPAAHIYRKEDVLAYRLPQAVGKWATIDPKLSHLCRLGAFGQRRPKALYASAPGITYGVAFAEGANLHDPQKQAKPGTVYFFPAGEISNCEVMKARQGQLIAYSTSKFGSPAPAAGAAK